MYKYMYVYIRLTLCISYVTHFHNAVLGLLLAAPPKVAEKPVRYNPDKMSFQEKLALHRKTLEQQETLASTAHRPPARPSSAREGNRRPVLPELGVNRTSSAEAPAKGKREGWREGTGRGRSLFCYMYCMYTSTCIHFTVALYSYSGRHRDRTNVPSVPLRTNICPANLSEQVRLVQLLNT